MHPDELNKPLGLEAEPAALPRREIPWAGIAFGGLLFLGAGIFAFARLTDASFTDPSAALAALAPVQRSAAVREPSLDDTTSSITAAPPRASADQVEEASGVRVVRQGGGGAPGALIISVPQQMVVGLDPAPDRRLVEEGRFGPLPKIGADGAKPMDVYGRPLVTSAKLRAGSPKIAILIGGMGLNARATNAAIDALPADVTLGFAPYGRNLVELAAQAREKGHEMLLQAPMQGFGGEADEPGPHVLRTQAPSGEVVTRLHWHMSRFQGYAGVGGFMGARFTADANAFGAVMREVSRRGLFYFEDGASPRSLAASLAATNAAPLARADVTLDAKAEAIDDALAQLEKLARERGSAIGYATGTPIVVEKVARFARRLESRGIMLAPLSSLARVPDQATARVDP
ncbi:MAG: divergent polysaccharide deacetylase family protein [Beijerinckiaceae bacterium]|nr:divergent polysaccharide deacetylase family protein [Beijerinckiaceae bacterium]